MMERFSSLSSSSDIDRPLPSPHTIHFNATPKPSTYLGNASRAVGAPEETNVTSTLLVAAAASSLFRHFAEWLVC